MTKLHQDDPEFSDFSVSYDQMNEMNASDEMLQVSAKLTIFNKHYECRQTMHPNFFNDQSDRAKEFRKRIDEKMMRDLKHRAMTDFYQELGWAGVSYAHTSHFVMDMSRWVLHNVNDLNINQLYTKTWWFQDSGEAALFKLRWS